MPYLILIFAVFHFAKGNITVTPRNTVVLAGDRVELECGVEGNSTVYRWEISKPSTVLNIENIIRLDYSGSSVVNSNFSHLGIDVDQTGSGIIYYNSTNLEDAGNYTCRAVIRSEKEKTFYSAQLIVLESLPNCASNYDNENDTSTVNITMQCNLHFRGFWAPTMKWKQHDANGIANWKGQEVEDGIENQTIPNSHVTSSLTVSRDSLSKGTFFSCRIYFQRSFDGILIMNATNIPDFVYIWNSSVYSKDPSSSEASEHTDQRQALLVLWWFSICVALPILVVAVAVTSAGQIRKRMRARRERLEEEKERERMAAHVYENDERPENTTYADINESQISPVDNPPKTRPRLQTIKPDNSVTCLHQPEDQEDTSAESISQKEPVHGCTAMAEEIDQVDISAESILQIETVNDCVATAQPTVSDDLRIADAGPLYHTLDPNQSASAETSGGDALTDVQTCTGRTTL